MVSRADSLLVRFRLLLIVLASVSSLAARVQVEITLTRAGAVELRSPSSRVESLVQLAREQKLEIKRPGRTINLSGRNPVYKLLHLLLELENFRSHAPYLIEKQALKSS
ncbi:uncharacterized protein LOC112347489 [Selaginella moellendorffii]|uniref:uncharacterized protein LOC112347489 n=1 Tax=Selaginella moellendorffii TaxID=88036 RepID=UPI000D1C531A|nr:uncharacterized protein LOC112347489 [Selaginella moellendorffii]|eukprot:XP_024534197.1 uncharacterized protein LOC112347489 [Selaginella moellendorffii]